ncbi:MAG: FAD-dependent oxidoreductase [bacterium]|nr:FAD-dependent oxidoreductase [bacterium]
MGYLSIRSDWYEKGCPKGYQQGRQEIYQLLQIMRDKIAGCGQARIKAIANLLGVRETRRIVGIFG